MTIGREPEVPKGFVHPDNPMLAGPHLILDKYKQRRWAWWVPDPNIDGLGNWLMVANAGTPFDFKYIGPAVTPDGKPL